MNGKMLLDTHIVIGLFAQDKDIQIQLSQTQEVFIPSIVLGELYYGARNSNRMKANVARIDQFALQNEILACDTETSRHYGLIKHGLKLKGRPIPENDIWIAALAVQYSCVVSRDDHFSAIDDLNLVPW